MVRRRGRTAESVRQAGVRVRGDVAFGNPRQFPDVLHAKSSSGSQRAVKAARAPSAAQRELCATSAVWPESVRTEASVMVPEITTAAINA